MLILCFYYTQINFTTCVKNAFVTYVCFEWWTQQVNGCVDCALFNAVLSVYLHS